MPTVAGITHPQIAIFGGTGSIGVYCVDAAVHCANARTVYYDDDPTRMAVAEKLGAEVADINGKREKNFHLAVDTSADPDRLRKALLSVVPEGYVNSVGIYFTDVEIPMLQLYLRGVHFHNGKGHARPNMTPTLDAVAAGTLHPQLVTSGIYGWDEIPDVLTSHKAGTNPSSSSTINSRTMVRPGFSARSPLPPTSVCRRELLGSEELPETPEFGHNAAFITDRLHEDYQPERCPVTGETYPLPQ